MGALQTCSTTLSPLIGHRGRRRGCLGRERVVFVVSILAAVAGNARRVPILAPDCVSHGSRPSSSRRRPLQGAFRLLEVDAMKFRKCLADYLRACERANELLPSASTMSPTRGHAAYSFVIGAALSPVSFGRRRPGGTTGPGDSRAGGLQRTRTPNRTGRAWHSRARRRRLFCGSRQKRVIGTSGRGKSGARLKPGSWQ